MAPARTCISVVLLGACGAEPAVDPVDAARSDATIAIDATVTTDAPVDAAAIDATIAPVDADLVDAPLDARAPVIVEVPCTTVAVTIGTTSSSFDPPLVTVTTGQIVRFAPMSPHDATAGTPGAPESWFMIYGGDPRCLRFDEPGTFPYFCSVHPTMAGRVTVAPPTP